MTNYNYTYDDNDNLICVERNGEEWAKLDYDTAGNLVRYERVYGNIVREYSHSSDGLTITGTYKYGGKIGDMTIILDDQSRILTWDEVFQSYSCHYVQTYGDYYLFSLE